jgi:hypothetical protein
MRSQRECTQIFRRCTSASSARAAALSVGWPAVRRIQRPNSFAQPHHVVVLFIEIASPIGVAARFKYALIATGDRVQQSVHRVALARAADKGLPLVGATSPMPSDERGRRRGCRPALGDHTDDGRAVGTYPLRVQFAGVVTSPGNARVAAAVGAADRRLGGGRHALAFLEVLFLNLTVCRIRHIMGLCAENENRCGCCMARSRPPFLHRGKGGSRHASSPPARRRNLVVAPFPSDAEYRATLS